jgi:hypothetical protein
VNAEPSGHVDAESLEILVDLDPAGLRQLGPALDSFVKVGAQNQKPHSLIQEDNPLGKMP